MEILTHVKTAFYICREQKGTVQHITGILAEQGINILGSVINDGTEYGVIRMIVSESGKSPRFLGRSRLSVQTH